MIKPAHKLDDELKKNSSADTKDLHKPLKSFLFGKGGHGENTEIKNRVVGDEKNDCYTFDYDDNEDE